MNKMLSVKGEKKEHKERFVHVVKRSNSTFLYRSFVRLFAIAAAFVIVLIFLQAVTGKSAGIISKYLNQGSFMSTYSKQAFVKDSMLLLLVALALAPAYRMRFWNIGGQGQILMGGLLACVCMKYFTNIESNSTMLFVMLLFSVLAGGIWALIPAFFKVKLNANETLFTLMMNYIAIQLVACCVDIWKGKNSGLPMFNSDTKIGWMKAIGDEPYGFIILMTVLIMFAIFFYVRNTKHGYELTIVGESMNTARYAGINTSKVILRTMFLSGAICGLVGFMYVGVSDHMISTSTSGSYGFTAIIVAWGASFNPFGMLAISFLITFISKGTGNVANYVSNLNSYTAYITVSVLLFLLIGCEFFIRYKFVFNSKTVAKTNQIKEKLYNKNPKFFDKLNAFKEKCSVFAKNTNDKYNEITSLIADTITSIGAKAVDGIKNVLTKKKTSDATEEDK